MSSYYAGFLSKIIKIKEKYDLAPHLNELQAKKVN